MSDARIHSVKKISITSRDLGEDLGMSTRIEVSSQPSWSNEIITEELVLFSNKKLITNLNGKTISHTEYLGAIERCK